MGLVVVPRSRYSRPKKISVVTSFLTPGSAAVHNDDSEMEIQQNINFLRQWQN